MFTVPDTFRGIEMLKKVFDMKDLYGRGRARILISLVFDNVVSQLVSGIFYTSLLLHYGMDKSQLGILAVLPTFTFIVNIFVPSIMERFRRRKVILVSAKLLQAFLGYVGVAILPVIVKDQQMRLIGISILLCLSSLISQVTASGWNVWNANYLQDHLIDNFYFVANLVLNIIAQSTAVIISIVADFFADTPNEIQLLTGIRCAAFGIIVLDAVLWIFQKEFPYEKSVGKIKISNVFTLPLKNKAFMMVMAVIFLHNFALSLPNATLNAYLLEDVKISYTLITSINAVYFLFFILFTKAWMKVINKFNRYGAYGIAVVLLAFTYVLYTFVTEDTIWLYVVVRLIQHILNVALSVLPSSVFYENLPTTDRTCYVSFNQMVVTLACSMALMVDTLLAGVWGDGAIQVLGVPVYSTQITLFMCAVMLLFLGKLLFKLSGRSK